MLNALVLFLMLLQAGVKTLPATDVKAAAIQTTLKDAMAKSVTDTQIRTVDGGGHNIGVAVVYRLKGMPGNAALHDKVSEIYNIIEGSGTLVTGGAIVNPQRRDSGSESVTQLNGPGVTGTAIQGGVSRRITRGDMVIIPAGTAHAWTEIQETMTYTVVRVDPGRLVKLK